MKSLNGAAVAAAWSALAAGGAAHAQEAVQWRVEDGGNGHWYQAVMTPMPWSDARVVAESRGGHLATPLSEQENDFVLAMAQPPGSGSADFWIGGIQAAGACEPGCGWSWITGEPFDYTEWRPNEPNNSGGFESVIHLWIDGGWNDTQPGIARKFLIEYSADCNGDGVVDYGQTLDGSLADLNANGIPDTCECIADITGNGEVSGADISVLLGFWGKVPEPLPSADINRDGLVDGLDLAVLLGSWGPCQ